ncbi:MAG: SUMF1/EgtB/PvdO family nonheme iron enzyme [Polyangiaceae bacterium]|nr:SUMF1/EgtB/PvdO family nonheme iron enzyme [Polyangiaceae bacterium]
MTHSEHRGYLALAGALFASLVGAALLMLPRLRAELALDTGPAAEPPATVPPAPEDGEPADPDLGDAPAEPVPAASAAASEPASPPGPPPCPEGMLFVEGRYCPFVAHRCLEHVPEDPSLAGKPHVRDRRCLRFADEALCQGRPSDLRFCIDRYEYPNLAGTKPAVLVDYRQARAACAAEGKRLCHEDEWMLGCEGAEGYPYPHGTVRVPGVCNVDGKVYSPDRRALATPALVSGELERIDGRVPSGSAPRCMSPFGVLDMSGNVAEWVHLRGGRPAGPPFESSVAGGGWGPNEATCRALDTDEPPSFKAPEVGFRCCRDADGGKPARRLWPNGTSLPRRRTLPARSTAPADTGVAAPGGSAPARPLADEVP